MKPLTDFLSGLSNERRRLLLAIGVVILTAILFSPILTHEFVNLDDPVFVSRNPHVLHGITANLFRWAFTSTAYEGNWIPLTWVVHAAIIHLFGVNPAFHHAASLLLHTLNGLLIFLLFDRLTRHPYRSAVVALLFAIHPLHVQSVAWAAELKDLQSTFFMLLTIWVYLRYRSSRSVPTYLLLLVCYAAALLSKSMVVTLPLLLLLLDWWPLGVLRSGALRMLLLEKIPLLLISAVATEITYSAHQSIGAIVSDISIPERISRSFISYIHYMLKIFFPVDLAVFYPFDNTPPSPFMITMAAVLLSVLTIATIRARQTHPYLIMGWFWYLLALLPVIGLVQIGDHSIADRYTYIPSIGFFVAAVWAVSDYVARFRVPSGFIASVTMVLLLAMAAVTGQELQYWNDTFTLLGRAIEVTEGNWLAFNNLGQAYLSIGRVDEALSCFEESLKAKPDYSVALVNLAALLALKNRNEEAVEALEQALRINPRDEKARLLLMTLPVPVAEGKH